MAIVGDQPRLATAVCRTDCLLAVAEADNLDALIESNPVFTQRLIKNFANRLHSSEQTMLKSMADIGVAYKHREESLASVCRVLAAVAAYGRAASAFDDAEITALASRCNAEKSAVQEIVAAIAGAKEDTSPETIIQNIIEKL